MSRRWDREPETKADKKFFDARGSGYKGWIDQDGNKMTDAEQKAWMTKHDGKRR